MVQVLKGTPLAQGAASKQGFHILIRQVYILFDMRHGLVFLCSTRTLYWPMLSVLCEISRVLFAGWHSIVPMWWFWSGLWKEWWMPAADHHAVTLPPSRDLDLSQMSTVQILYSTWLQYCYRVVNNYCTAVIIQGPFLVSSHNVPKEALLTFCVCSN